MASYLDDNADLRWYLERGVDWAPLLDLVEFGYRSGDGPANADEALQAVRDVLALVGRFAAEEIAPRIPAIDRRGHRLEGGRVVSPPEFGEIFERMREAGLFGLPVPRELGGAGCPLLASFIATELLGRADIAVLAHYGFHWGIAMALLTYSVLEGSSQVDRATGRIVRTRFEAQIREILEGTAWGSMDITEPHAGSDMGALRTRGEQDASGSWFVTGEKAFITSGHGRHHILVARTEPSQGDSARPGLEGLSLFLVRGYDLEDGVRKPLATVDRVEEKLGMHGGVTVAVSFDRVPAELIGRRGEGFRNMLLMMNNARLQVGMEALGLCEAAHRQARAWAAERRSMGRTLERHELVADWLDEMDTDIRSIRALALHGGWHEEMAQRLRLHALLLHDEGSPDRERLLAQSRAHQAESREATPLVKYVAAEKAVEIARRCLQIHGGFGYMTEYPPQKLLRDALVFPIYEGTSQIQALMAMKDTLGAITKKPGAFVSALAGARMRSLSARDPLERRTAGLRVLALSAQERLVRRTAADKLRGLKGSPVSQWSERFLRRWDPERDFAAARLHAERLTRLLSDAKIAEVLRDQTRRDPARRELWERFLERAEPRARAAHDEIAAGGARLLRSLSHLPPEGTAAV